MRRKRGNQILAAAMSAALMIPAFPAIPAQAEAGAAEENGLCFQFDMENMDGNQITNTVTGQKYDISGNAALEEGKEGSYALRFNGNESIDLGTEFQPVNEYTMMGWIKPAQGGKATQAVFSRGRSGNPSDYLALLTKNGGIFHNVAFGDGSSNSQYEEFLTPAGLTEEKWNHVAVTRSGSSVAAYIDGELVYSADNCPASDFVEFQNPMYIGMDAGSDGTLWQEHAFTGAMDDLRLYDTALDESEIREIYDSESKTFSVLKVENGKITLQLDQELTAAPDQDEFTVRFLDGETEVKTEQTDFVYDEHNNQIQIGFTPLTNTSADVKNIQVEIEYKDYKVSASLELPAGDNHAPAVSDAKVTNLTTELGAEPHVKGMLKAEYTYADEDNDAEGETKYQWYMADTPDGEYEPIQGIRTQTVILLDKYEGKYLKCEITPADINGNVGEAQWTTASEAVQPSEGNPLTDWFMEAQFGVSHHLLSEFVVLDFVSTEPGEKWDSSKESWDEYLSTFDAEAYAEEISKTGAQFVTITLGQNAAEYCAPNLVYDKYLREAGLLGEDEVNPKTVSFENDLPMKIANALEPYGIKVMLYLPSNVPHSAHWNAGDYAITEKALKGQRGSNGPNSQEAKKILCEMVEWWSLHYGDKIAGWWFDGMYPGGTLESQNDMSLEYNVSTLANAAKAGNPYNIVSFNQGTSISGAFGKNTEYHDYTAGECNDFNQFPVDGRWAQGTDDCQNFVFGCLGKGGWNWGAAGTRFDNAYVEQQMRTAIDKQYVMQLDVKVNRYGKVDPEQLAQLEAVKESIWGEDEPVSKNTLEYFLNSAKEHVANGDVENCVESVQKLFEEAIAEGEVVMADENATRDEVMNAAMKLMKAIHALDMKAADKTDLEMAVELGDMIDLSKYVEEGQKEFTDALAAAKEVLADGDALQGDVDTAWDALVTAMENLRLKANKDALEDLLDEAAGLDLSRYTEESAAAFRTALASAQAVLADETLSEDDQQKVDDAVAALKEAKDGLVAKTDDSGNGNTGDNNNNGAGGNDGNTSGTDNGSNTGNADKNNGNTNSGNSVNKAAKTGDAAPVMGLMALVLVSGAAVLTVSRKRTR